MSRTLRAVAVGALLLGVATFTSTANAAASYCPALPGTNSDGMALDDVTIAGQNASQCYGIITTISPSNPTNERNFINNNDIFGTTNFAFLAKSGAADAGGIAGLDFDVTAVGGPTGSFVINIDDLSGAPPNLPVTLDLVVMLKSSTGHTAYLFEDVQFLTEGNTNGTYEVKIQNDNGQFQNLSHLTLLGALVQNPPGEVPEPATLALLGAGMLGLGLVGRRRRQ